MLFRSLLKAVKDGEIEESLVDEKVRNILRMMLRLKMIGPERKHRKTGAYNTEEHRRAVLDVARESIRTGEEVQKSRHCMRYHRLWESKSYLVEM